jgi:hypothetical protein
MLKTGEDWIEPPVGSVRRHFAARVKIGAFVINEKRHVRRLRSDLNVPRFGRDRRHPVSGGEGDARRDRAKPRLTGDHL